MANKTKDQLIAELKSLGVVDFDETATNAALEALLAATIADHDALEAAKADEIEAEAAETAAEEEESTEEEETVEEDEDEAPEATEEAEEESEEDEEYGEEEETLEPSVAIITRKGVQIKSFTARLDGLNWLKKAHNFRANNKGTEITVQ